MFQKFALNYRGRAKVNLDALLKHGTIELRDHDGTTDPEKVMAFLKFADKLMALSIKQVKESGVHLPTAGEKTAMKNFARALRKAHIN